MTNRVYYGCFFHPQNKEGENMIRILSVIILFSLLITGCNRQDAGKNGEQNGSAEQGVSDSSGEGSNPEEALFKEIQTIAKRDFRKASWGMPRSEVVLTEADDPTSQDDSALIYSRKVAGMSALIGYLFVDDKLVKGKYMFRQQHSEFSQYITDYDTLKKAMEKKYGKAQKSRDIWSNDLYTNIPAEWGKAVSLGYLTRLSYWSTKTTEITLTLKGENEKIDLWLEYKSKALAKLMKKSGEK
jgi:hypothetical protein